MTSRTSARRASYAVIVSLIVVLMALIPGAARAQEPAALTYDFEGRLTADGVLDATATITYSSAPDSVVQRLALRQPIDSQRSYLYEISDVTATIGGAAADVTTQVDGDYLVVTVDTSGAGGEAITLNYTVDGTTRNERGVSGDMTVFSWRVLQGLSTGVEHVTGSLVMTTMAQHIDCLAGPPGSVNKCDLYSAGTHDSPMPEFQSADRGAGEQVTLIVGVDAAAMTATADIEESWSLDRAFSVTPVTAFTALGVLLLGGAILWLLHRRTGVDQGYDGDADLVATFVPVAEGRSVFEVRDGVRPGEVGTLADERVDPVDVTATLLDLAVRGHLHITELPREAHELLDWRLARTEQPHDGLLAYEKRFLDAIAPEGGSTLVSELPQVLAPAIGDIQSDLYDEVVTRGWFEQRPDATRNSWRVRGYVGLGIAIAAAVALVAFTTFGLLALVLLILAGILVWVSGLMPRRTAKGSKLVTGMRALSALLTTQPTDRMPKGREIEEISKLLPYAVVLGGRNRWLQAMVDADDCDETPDPYAIDWYHAPETWHLQDLPTSLTQFINTVQGELFGR